MGIEFQADDQEEDVEDDPRRRSLRSLRSVRSLSAASRRSRCARTSARIRSTSSCFLARRLASRCLSSSREAVLDMYGFRLQRELLLEREPELEVELDLEPEPAPEPEPGRRCFEREFDDDEGTVLVLVLGRDDERGDSGSQNSNSTGMGCL